MVKWLTQTLVLSVQGQPWYGVVSSDSLLHNTAPVQVYLSLLWVQSTLVIADTVQGSELVSLLVQVCNSGSLFQSNACNLFLPGT